MPGATVDGVAKARLTQERKSWRKDHPFGFVARPQTMPDGSVNLLKWRCQVPGKKGTSWEGGLYPVDLFFSEDYPAKPPLVQMAAHFFHPNVYSSGKVCLSIIDEAKAWKPSITVKQILIGLQELLDNPNNADPAQDMAYQVYAKNKAEYHRRVKAQAAEYKSDVYTA